jgi:hypothetical protein
MTPLERDLIVRTIYGEAANEPEDGQAAVARVIQNRLRAGSYGPDIRSVIMQRNAFEPWGTDEGRSRMKGLQSSDPRYQAIGAVVDRAWADPNDASQGATHFYSPTAQAALGRRPPAWATPETSRGEIGRHAFFAPDGGRRRVAAPAGLPEGFELVPDDAPMALAPAQPSAQAAPGVQAAARAAQPAPAAPTPASAPANSLPPGFELVPDQPAAPVDRSRFGDAMPAEGVTSEQVAAAARRDQGIQTAVARRDARADGSGWLAMRAALRGAGMGFADEGAAAVGATVGGGAMSRAPTWSERYNENLVRARAIEAADAAEAPNTNLAASIAGGVGTGIAAPIGAGVRTLAGLAGLGAGMGAVSGFGAGEGGATNRAVSSAIGAGVGGVLAPVAAGVTSGVTRVAGALASPLAPYISAARGLINPTAEAERRTAGAIARDARVAGRTPQQLADDVLVPAAQAGQPAIALDVGRETTRALGRSAANTSTEGRAALTQALDSRFENQTDRVVSFLRRLVPGTDNPAQRAAVQDAARAANNPAYRAAYRAAPAGVWDDSLATLADAPAMQTAIRQALVTMRNEGTQTAAGGIGPAEAARRGVAPPVTPTLTRNAQGQLELAAGGVTPGIQFWDQVQRNLRAMGGREAESLRRTLNQHLDGLVPSFRDARAGAARFFDAEDAIDAGRNFVTPGRLGMENPEARRALAAMSPEEQAHFRQGFTAEMVRMLENVRDRRDVLDQIFMGGPRGSAAARERIEIAMGPQAARELEGLLRVENIFSQGRGALQGNSTTVRQLVEAGLAGGAAGAYSEDWRTAGAVGAAHIAARRYGIPAVDQRVAQRVGEILASGDPAQIQRLVQRAASNGGVMRAIRMIEGVVVGQQSGERAADAVTPASR